MSVKKMTATEKTMAIFEAAIGNGHLSHIAQTTELPVATVHRILADMVRSEWLFQGDERVYRPGRRALGLASKLQDESHLGAIAQPFLAELTDKTGLTAHLGMMHNDAIVYAAKVDARKPYRMNSRVGGSVPMHSSAIGKAVLANLPNEQASALIDRTGTRAITAKTLTNPEQLQLEFVTIRNRGWSQEDEENEEGLSCVGAVIPGMAGGVSVTGLTHEVDQKERAELAKAVQDAAQQISIALGHEEEKRERTQHESL